MSEKVDDESLLGMEELEPSPIEDTPISTSLDGSKEYFPQSSSPTPPSHHQTTLGLGNHGPAWYLTRVQKYSSYTFTIFAAFHITNTSIIPLITQSVPASEPYILLTRPYYQSPLAEPMIVIIPLIAHIASGVALRLYRRKQNLDRNGAETRRDRRLVAWPKVSGISKLGYLLLPLALGHAYTTRILPPDQSSINLSYISHAFAKHAAVAYAGFSALISVAVLHSVWGWAKWLGWTQEHVTHGGVDGQRSRKRRWYAINSVSALVAGLWLAGGLGVVGRGGETGGWIGREYDELLRSIPIVGDWF
ncbi:hypothetical protein LTR28_013432 [Elasticomyces elasticus]|nr:hypothetical protein LTR28_013432 [Elasticomyces elasticus]